ncbi:KpsF/GutQ family sugar-phosphate isomerase [Gloeocapsopsis crepidinum LEGE 06123]|uniref:KpsF/GutQ family sugar-phosphate isomerase n=1 Tax=Gloeocapsopsis crepidinum LEGE 06123 TaxID=588587 RepID=A0ABR9UZ93_9CHRO|nr:KpsF/GutQ family sugar-phosphate isomerase [Gloeocapsopsis crepidinum]MBE9193635.1 KpsF/GutQ family sugar-phosphate isomerase [Gloeocapsopsis crepidinum LEGE 06123]
MQCIDNKTYVLQVVELLKLEAEAITKAANRLQSEHVEKAVEILANCRGKVVLAGVGKSGIVARKIAATLTSTGTLAVYLHPADALHGDLGIVTSDDVAMVLSNSGETDELVVMLPHLKARQVPIIALVGNLRSTLARNADVVMDAAVDKEACPFNLAPTTSTTVALSIGDALAMTLMQVKGLTPEGFAVNHPAGRLGKRLTLRVRDLMHSGVENPTVSPQASWIEVLTTISKGGLGAVNVVDDLGHLLGIITDGDLRRLLQKAQHKDLDSFNAIAIMTANPVVVSPELLAFHALELMENRPSQISILPVVDGQEHCIGLIRLHDIVRCGI